MKGTERRSLQSGGYSRSPKIIPLSCDLIAVKAHSLTPTFTSMPPQKHHFATLNYISSTLKANYDTFMG